MMSNLVKAEGEIKISKEIDDRPVTTLLPKEIIVLFACQKDTSTEPLLSGEKSISIDSQSIHCNDDKLKAVI